MIEVRNKILPGTIVSVGKPSLFMDKSVLESLTNEEHQKLNQQYAVIHTVTLFQEIQKNTIEKRMEKQPDYISLIKKLNETNIPKQEHYITMMKLELLGHAVILNRSRGTPYLVPSDFSVQQMNWVEGRLSAADIEKAEKIKQDSMIRAVDVGTEHFMGGDGHLATRLKRDLECLTKSSVTLSEFISEISDKLQNHLSIPDPVLNELYFGFNESERFKKSKKQAPNTVTTFEITLDEIDRIKRNWDYIKSNLQIEFPYTFYFLVVNAFLNIGIPELKLRQQMSLKKDDTISDLHYLYYLPFCNIFVSKDRFHRKVVPEFLTDQQHFIWFNDLKKDISKHVPSACENFIIWPNFRMQ